MQDIFETITLSTLGQNLRKATSTSAITIDLTQEVDSNGKSVFRGRYLRVTAYSADVHIGLTSNSSPTLDTAAVSTGGAFAANSGMFLKAGDSFQFYYSESEPQYIAAKTLSGTGTIEVSIVSPKRLL